MTNLAVRFVLELCMLAAVSYWGFKTQNNGVAKALLGVGVPVLLAAFWGLFVSPKATFKLSSPVNFALKLFLLSLGAAALFASGKPVLGWVYSIALAVSTILMVVWKQ